MHDQLTDCPTAPFQDRLKHAVTRASATRA